MFGIVRGCRNRVSIKWLSLRILLTIVAVLLLSSCDGAPPAEAPPVPSAAGNSTSSVAPTDDSPLPATDAPLPTAETASGASEVIVGETEEAPPQPANTAAPTSAPAPTKPPSPTPAPLPTEPPPPTPEPLFYNLPPALLTSSTGLYASPNRSELIVAVPIPAGEIVYVMGKNATGSHLRVVWSTGVGWVPVSFTDFNGKRDRLNALPVFVREPPGCAVPITTQFGLNSQWHPKEKQRIAVVVDLFRSRYGDFPNSSLSLEVNGQEVASSKRLIVEQGQFSLKDIVLSLPQDVQPGDTVGYLLQTSSDEPLSFTATIFNVPSSCKWDID